MKKISFIPVFTIFLLVAPSSYSSYFRLDKPSSKAAQRSLYAEIDDEIENYFRAPADAAVKDIQPFNELLKTFFFTEIDTQSPSKHLIQPLIAGPQDQEGESCKLKALSDAITGLSETGQGPFVALYKNHNHGKVSLRKIAKNHASQVGEVYSIQMLQAICRDAGYSSSFLAPDSSFNYIFEIINLLQQNIRPIVFFDMELDESSGRRGFPRKGDGSNEHAAVIVGYYEDVRYGLIFIVFQYSRYYCFIANELAESSLYSLAEKREPERFSKVRNAAGKSFWILTSKVESRAELSLVEGVAPRLANPMAQEDIPLKGKIFIVKTAEAGPAPLPLSANFFLGAGGLPPPIQRTGD